MPMLFKRIKDWAVSITSFRTGDVIAVDGPNGTAKMEKDSLLSITADNVYSSLGNEFIDDNSNIVRSGDYVRYVLDTVGVLSEGYGIVADPNSDRYGQKITSVTCNAYENIRCDAYDMIAVNLPFPVASPFSLGLVFYDSDGTALPDALLKKHMTDPDMKSGIVLIEVPGNAYKFSTSVKNTDTLYCVGLVKKNKPVSFYPNKSVVCDSNSSSFGKFITGSLSKSSKPMLCDGYTKVLASNILPATSDNTRGICFYDKTMTPIAGYYGLNASTTTTNTQVFDIPQNAVFFSFTINQADNTYELKLINDSGLDEFVLGEKLSTVSFNSASSYEQGAIDVYTGNPVLSDDPMYPKRIRTDFIVVPGGSFIYVSASSEYSLQVLEYDMTKTYTKYSSGVFNSYHKLRGDTAFIRLVFNKIERRVGQPTYMVDVSPSDYSDIDASLNVYAFAVSDGIKKPYTSEKVRFKVLVNQNPIPDCDYSGVFAQTTDAARKNALYALATSGLEDIEILQTSTGVLALPTNYTKNGTKTKLILFAHGGHGYVDDTHWYPTNSDFPATLDRLLAAGYAVFDCNGYKDTSWAEIQQIWNAGNVQISEGLPQVCEAYYKCYKYIIENYNIDPRIYIWGCSQGGHLAMNFGYCHRDIVAAIAMMAGQIDLYDQGYAYQTLENKRQVAKLLGFSDTTFTDNTEAMAAYEHYRADKWDPMQRLAMIDGKTYVLGWNAPIKFFYGTADTTLPQIKYTINLVEALQNSKVICYLRVYDGYDHDDVALGKSGIATREALEWFNRF